MNLRSSSPSSVSCLEFGLPERTCTVNRTEAVNN